MYLQRLQEPPFERNWRRRCVLADMSIRQFACRRESVEADADSSAGYFGRGSHGTERDPTTSRRS